MTNIRRAGAIAAGVLALGALVGAAGAAVAQDGPGAGSTAHINCSELVADMGAMHASMAGMMGRNDMGPGMMGPGSMVPGMMGPGSTMMGPPR
jgi:hypothetical protein